MGKKADPTIRNLYPDFSEKEVAEAEDNLHRYLALVLRMFERKECETDHRRLSGSGSRQNNV